MKAPSDHIRILRRRVDFLKSREHKNSFDLAELGALEWALVNLPSKPVAWVGLTDEEIHDIYDQVAKQEPYSGAVTRRNVARAIEAKLREKNT